MPEQTRAVKLLKFGRRNYMEKFQGGVLYMNTLKHFQTSECCKLRSDKDEGLSAVYQANGAILFRQNGKREFVHIGTVNNQMHYRDREKDPEHQKIFCMYALQVEPQKQKIDERNFGFGDTCVLILDPKEFLNRVKCAAAQKRIEVYHKLVEYVDRKKYNGKIGAFRKFSEFSYQNEFRILIFLELPVPYEFNIGNISDITELRPIHDAI